LNGLSWHWLERQAAENNPAFKQLIPYVVVQHTDGSQTACYRRSGNEKRLHAFWSIGIGGHVNPVDGAGTGTGLQATIAGGLQRELAEELGPDLPQPQAIGLINEERTGVGTVHPGLVYALRIRPDQPLVPCPELADFHWRPTPQLDQLKLELWSSLALGLVG